MKNKSPVSQKNISLIFLILWMGLIFYFSHQNSTESSGMSEAVIRYILNIFMPDLSQEKLSIYITSLQFFVRKAAHFSIYAILGVLCYIHIMAYDSVIPLLKIVISLVISSAYAASDEYHQTFISGRSGEIRDVLIDSAGAFCGILLAFIVFKFIKRSDKMKKKQYMELVDTLGLRLNKEKNRNRELTAENSALNAELLELKNRISKLEATNTTTLPVIEEDKKIPEKVITEVISPKSEPILTDGISQGSKIIGKIVLSSAKYCNELTSLGASANAKELVNLILGRTEVAKGEILRLSALDINPNERLLAMERELNSAEDYFRSVMAQKS